MYKNIEDRNKYSHEYYLKHKNETINRTRKYYLDNKEHLDEMAKLNKKNKGIKFMDENKECSMYLGCHIAENILSREFKNITRMKVTNIGYDYICGKGFKIDVKSACLVKDKWGSEKWKFHIEKNIIADYFLCIGFDNREDLNPLHIWLINGKYINDKIGIGISNNEKSLLKYKIYERPLDNAIMCCNKMKEI